MVSTKKKTSPKPSWVPQRSWTQDFVWQEKNGILVRLSSRVSGETQHKNTRCFSFGCEVGFFEYTHNVGVCCVEQGQVTTFDWLSILGCLTNLYIVQFSRAFFLGGRSLPGGVFNGFAVGSVASIFGKISVENRNPGA